MKNKVIASIDAMKSQFFNIFIIAVVIVNGCGTLLNFSLHGLGLPSNICIICSIAMLPFILFGCLTKYKTIAIACILVLVEWIEFPLLYYVYGSEFFVYLILSIVGVVLFIPIRFSVPFCIATILIDAIMIAYRFYYPCDYIVPDTALMIFSLCSFVIISATIYTLILLFVLKYEKQKANLNSMNIKLNYMASHDPLTKVYNRGYLMGEIERRIKTQKDSFITIIIDVDNFKTINDTYGHTVGDEVLVSLAEMLMEETKKDGLVARFGGEEFVIVLDHTNIEQAKATLKSVSEKLADKFKNKLEMAVTFSGGLELYSATDNTVDLIANADVKLYKAKQNGKNQIVTD